MVVPVRGHLDSIKRLLKGDRYIGRGSRQWSLCRPSESCHGDILIEEFKRSFPGAYDRFQDRGVPPDPKILIFMARLREEPESKEGSSPDEGVPPKMSGL